MSSSRENGNSSAEGTQRSGDALFPSYEQNAVSREHLVEQQSGSRTDDESDTGEESVDIEVSESKATPTSKGGGKLSAIDETKQEGGAAEEKEGPNMEQLHFSEMDQQQREGFGMSVAELCGLVEFGEEESCKNNLSEAGGQQGLAEKLNTDLHSGIPGNDDDLAKRRRV